ncbi:MAG: hypothetical protein P9L92_13400 [Candidatus Electryonea clarkiae]|nr:hypothetical protein [Candidatus Electryonea clarkiae]MDP8288897.1 hypothetical protein [Candidatus Electryonea clarkiae]
MHRIIKFFFPFALSICLCPQVYASEQNEYSVQKSMPLIGLKKFIILIEELDNDLAAQGLNKQILKEDIESKLQLAGIKVAPVVEAPETPWLYVRITSLMSRTGQFSYNISFDLNANVKIEFNDKVVKGATIWSSDLLVVVDKKRVVESVRQNIKDMMETFLMDYHTANPP